MDLDQLRRTGTIGLDRAAIDRAVLASVRANRTSATVRWRLRGDAIEVQLTDSVPVVFARDLRSEGPRTVTAVATAELEVRAP